MTRILLICHEGIGHALREVAETILAGPSEVNVVDVEPGDDVDVVCQAIGSELGALCAAQPPLVLTDLPGATPHNLAVEAVGRLCPRAPILTGLNLPMLLRAASHRDLPAGDLADLAADGAHAAIFLGGGHEKH